MNGRNFDDIIIIFKERIKYLLRSAKSTKPLFTKILVVMKVVMKILFVPK